MRKQLLTAIFALCLLAPSGAFAYDDTPVSTDKSACCTVTKTVRVRGEIEGYKTVPVYSYHKKTVQVAAPCCAKPEPVKVEEPAPETIVVKKKVFVVEQPEIIRVPAPPIIVQQRPVCCPGTNNPCAAQSPASYREGQVAAPQATQVNWTHQGPSDQCNGRPKGVPFQCLSPISGHMTNCLCH
jgi:hypothetical protein